ncbi:hypothetical protein K1719_045881 [Acacia pycnantha]|nr:hypothetical protein K1719_045881 [Acacia pycnantha]
MVRGKIEMKKIENATSRQVTFSKRRSGLLKKAYELSVLCDAQVAVIIFSQRGRLYEFSSSDISKILERYWKYSKVDRLGIHPDEQYSQQMKVECAMMAKKIEHLQLSQRKLMGEELSSCSIEDLQEIENQLITSLQHVRLRKDRNLIQQNASFTKLCGRTVQWQNQWTQHKEAEVETELRIGLPQNQCS